METAALRLTEELIEGYGARLREKGAREAPEPEREGMADAEARRAQAADAAIVCAQRPRAPEREDNKTNRPWRGSKNTTTL